MEIELANCGASFLPAAQCSLHVRFAARRCCRYPKSLLPTPSKSATGTRKVTCKETVRHTTRPLLTPSRQYHQLLVSSKAILRKSSLMSLLVSSSGSHLLSQRASKLTCWPLQSWIRRKVWQPVGSRRIHRHMQAQLRLLQPLPSPPFDGRPVCLPKKLQALRRCRDRRRRKHNSSRPTRSLKQDV